MTTILNQRYIVLSSTYRNRNLYPNPYDFVAGPKLAPTNATNANDWTSLSAPILNWNMLNYFTSTTATSAPYQWQQSGTILSSEAPDTTFFMATIGSRGNVGAPAIVTNQYLGCYISYNNGTDTFYVPITGFVAQGGNFAITVGSEITTAGSPNNTFTIVTPYLNQYQLFIPAAILPANEFVQNQYTGYTMQDITNGITSTITSSFDQVLTGATAFNLGVGTMPTQLTVSPQPIVYFYTVGTISGDTITITSATNPTITAEMLIGQYIYDFVRGVALQIINATFNAGTITLTFQNPVPTTIESGDTIGILFFSSDNDAGFEYKEPMRETQWQDRGQTRVYDLQMVQLMLPNLVFTGDPGGTLLNYPYVTVTLRNETSNQQTNEIMFSNIPITEVKKATFTVPLIDVYDLPIAAFAYLDGNGEVIPFSIKASDTLGLTVRGPNGQVLQNQQADNVPPAIPVPGLQIMATFSVLSRPSTEKCPQPPGPFSSNVHSPGPYITSGPVPGAVPNGYFPRSR